MLWNTSIISHQNNYSGLVFLPIIKPIIKNVQKIIKIYNVHYLLCTWKLSECIKLKE